MKRNFGTMPDGRPVSLYTISNGPISATLTDLGATLVSLLVPDRNGHTADVVLGFDDAQGYLKSWAFLGTVIGRNANRIKGGRFDLNGRTVQLAPFERGNNLHSGIDFWCKRLWEVARHDENAITFRLISPDGDQGFPGRAEILVTYTLECPAALKISYWAVSDEDTVFNLTDHSYFNLAGHDAPKRAMEQTLMMPARYYTPVDAYGIPTGELRSVEGTAMDFRAPRSIGHQGFDHNFEAFCDPCAILTDPISGRSMAVSTDCPGLQLYTANGFHAHGKDGVRYGDHSAVCLETQFFPDAVNHPEWCQPFTAKNTPYESETVYRFTW